MQLEHAAFTQPQSRLNKGARPMELVSDWILNVVEVWIIIIITVPHPGHIICTCRPWLSGVVCMLCPEHREVKCGRPWLRLIR